jgi:hypothetical protein
MKIKEMEKFVKTLTPFQCLRLEEILINKRMEEGNEK